MKKLSFAGVASTGGHGSGITLGPIAESIKAIHLLTLDSAGKVRQIRVEAKEGISNPIAFHTAFPQVTLIQDDNYFQACKVSVGCLGLIYSLTIETQPAFFFGRKTYP